MIGTVREGDHAVEPKGLAEPANAALGTPSRALAIGFALLFGVRVFTLAA